MTTELATLLTSLRFVELKCVFGLTASLIDELQMALDAALIARAQGRHAGARVTERPSRTALLAKRSVEPPTPQQQQQQQQQLVGSDVFVSPKVVVKKLRDFLNFVRQSAHILCDVKRGGPSLTFQVCSPRGSLLLVPQFRSRAIFAHNLLDDVVFCGFRHSWRRMRTNRAVCTLQLPRCGEVVTSGDRGCGKCAWIAALHLS
jgi:hypothetical protein